jgi:2-dehydropantoate 2-reductase
MKIAVLGAGSLGCALGGVLADHGNEVTLVNRNANFCAVVNANGLTLNDGGAAGVTKTVLVQAIRDVASQPIQTIPFDLIIVLVKSKDTEAVVQSALPWVSENTVVMSLQNGLGHEGIIAGIVGKHRVLAGKTYCGGLMTAPGIVTIGIKNKETIIGELDGQITPRVTAIGKAFNDAGLLTTVSDNIMGAMWDKILVNVATGAICGATGLVYGDMYQVPELEACAIGAVSEAIAVAQAKDIPLSNIDPKAAWLKAGAGLAYDFKPSLLQSLERGVPSEIDYIAGAVTRAGRLVGVPTPINDTLVAIIKGIEKGFLK